MMIQWQNLLWVGFGGFLGANARYVISLYVNQHFPTIIGQPLPLATGFVNVIGSFVLALFLAYVSKQLNFPDGIKLMIGTGFLGAYTTFSTYANESIALINDGQWLLGLSYIFGTNLLCLLGVICGLLVANRIF